jgi:GMP synthase (glutamine-hydrolysing)
MNPIFPQGASMADVLVLQHVECEGLGSIQSALERAGLHSEHVPIFRGATIPSDLSQHRALVVMGGPMSVYEQERYSHLADELRLLRKAVDAGQPVLGICLGSQLLAAALGGTVTSSRPKEIGWYDVRLSAAAAADPLFSGLPRELTAFHWHGDQFSLPPGAVLLASSAVTPHQAFRYGRSAYGLLFHLEVTQSAIETMLNIFADEVRAEEIDVQAILSSKGNLVELERIGSTVFDRWASLVKACG